MTEVAAPTDGPLSVEQAMSALRAPVETSEPAPAEAVVDEAPEPEAEELPPEELESEAEPTADDIDDPEEPAIVDEQGVEPESDPVQPAIAAPPSWDAQGRADFAKLPRATQEIILAREVERDRAVSRAQSEANEAKRQVQTEVAGIAQLKATLEEVATNARAVFADRWANVDWATLARTDPAAYVINKADFDAEQAELQRVEQAQQVAHRAAEQAQAAEFQSYVQAEAAKLPEVAPELADPKEGRKRMQAVGQFLLSQGITSEALKGVSAVELGIAWDAYQWRQAKTKTVAELAKPRAPAPVAPRPATPRPAAPTAAQPAPPPRQRAVAIAETRLSKAGTVDNAMAVLRARRGG